MMPQLWPVMTLSCGTRVQVAGPASVGDVYICPVCDTMVSVIAAEYPRGWEPKP